MKNLLKKLAILLVLVGCNGGAVQAMDSACAQVTKSAEGVLEAVREGVRQYPLAVATTCFVGAVYLYHRESDLGESAEEGRDRRSRDLRSKVESRQALNKHLEAARIAQERNRKNASVFSCDVASY